MIRRKLFVHSMLYGIEVVWRSIFILVGMGVFFLAVGRYYVLTPRSLNWLFSELQRFGYPIYVKNATIVWRWKGSLCVQVRDLKWRQPKLKLFVESACFEFKLLSSRPLRGIRAENVHIDYVQKKTTSLDVLSTFCTATSLFQKISEIDICEVKNGVSILKNGVLQSRINSFSWTPEEKHKKIFGQIKGAMGDIHWFYIPEKRYMYAKFSNGVGFLLKALEYSENMVEHPLCVEMSFNSHGNDVKITWDKKELLINGKKYYLNNGIISAKLSAQKARFKGSVGVEQLNVFLKGEYYNNWTLKWRTSGSIKTQALEFWWNKNWVRNTKNWIDQHFKGGVIENLKGRVSGVYDMVTNLYGSLFLKNAHLEIVSGMPSIKSLSSRGEFNLNEFNFYIEKAFFSQQSIESGQIRIYDLSKDSKLTLALRLKGGVADVLNILDCKRLNVTKSLPINQAKGKAYTHLRMKFPLLLNLKFQDIILDYESGLEDTYFNVTALEVSLPFQKGLIHIKGTQHDLCVSGNGKMNRHPAMWTWKGVFKDPLNHKLTMDVSVDPCLWVPKWIHPCFQKELLPIHIEYFSGKGKLVASLQGEHIQLIVPWLKWVKRPKTPLTVVCEFLEKKKNLRLMFKEEFYQKESFF
ncbi:hypothetical protein P618_200951 [Holospora obtusa F1]|uniref:Uncharacterized protein n=1 Tax=Holospora obtusa F1 TaxID=1399147 RepID=W6TGB4_HOLOB|nr:DUF3971 domain-containing protein [Holospora obtusa]ETZ06880.1 hypothetical protein P618_200951 [Holospora obtusa F1]